MTFGFYDYQVLKHFDHQIKQIVISIDFCLKLCPTDIKNK